MWPSWKKWIQKEQGELEVCSLAILQGLSPFLDLLRYELAAMKLFAFLLSGQEGLYPLKS